MRWRRLLLGAAVTLGAAEAGLRWGVGLGDPPLVERDPEVEYRLVPSATYWRFGNRIAINSHGMRGPEHPAAAAPDERRILLVGDSVVYGNHHLDQSQTIAVRLAALLGVRPELAGCRPLAMAAAASSWGPVNQAAFLAETGLLGADLVVHLVSAHDLQDVPSFDDVIPYRLVPSHGALDDARQIVIERLVRRLRTRKKAAPIEEREAQTLAAMNRLRDQVRAAGVPLLLAYHPTIPERANGASRTRQIFRDWALESDVAFVDLGTLDLTAADYRDTIHPNASGASAIAGFLADVTVASLPPCP